MSRHSINAAHAMTVLSLSNRGEERLGRCEPTRSVDAGNRHGANRSGALAASVLKEAHIACRAIPAMAEEILPNRRETEGGRNGRKGAEEGGGYARTTGAEGVYREGGGWVTKGGASVDLELVVLGELLPFYAGGNGNSDTGDGGPHPYAMDTWRDGWVKRRAVDCVAGYSMVDKLEAAGFATSSLAMASSSSSSASLSARNPLKGEKGERGGEERGEERKNKAGGRWRALLGCAFRRRRADTGAVAPAPEELPPTAPAPAAVSNCEKEMAPWRERVWGRGDSSSSTSSSSSTCSSCPSSSSSSSSAASCSCCVPSSCSGYGYGLNESWKEHPPHRRRGKGLVMAASFVIDGKPGTNNADVAYGVHSTAHPTVHIADGNDSGVAPVHTAAGLTEEGGGGGGGGGGGKTATKKVLKYKKKRRATVVPPPPLSSTSSSTSHKVDGGSDTWGGGMDDGAADRLGTGTDHHYRNHHRYDGEESDGGDYVRAEDGGDQFGAKDAGGGYSSQQHVRFSSTQREAFPPPSPPSTRIPDSPPGGGGNDRHPHPHYRPNLKSMRLGKRIWGTTTSSDPSSLGKNGLVSMVSFLAKVAMLAMVKRGTYPSLWAVFQGVCFSNLPMLSWIHRFGPVHRALEPFHVFTRPMLVLSIATTLRNLEEEENTAASNVQVETSASGAESPVSPIQTLQVVDGEELFELQQKVDEVRDQLQLHDVQLPQRFNDREIARFLVAAHGSVENCVLRLKQVSQWHTSYLFLSEAGLLAWNSFVSWHGQDMFGRPCLVLRIGRACQVLRPSQRQQFVQALVSQTEYGVTQLLQDFEVEQFSVVMDCGGVGLFNAPVSLIKNAALMLQQNYPTRLAQFYLINLQMVLRSLVASVKLVLGERTSRKIRIAGAEASAVLEECFGGIEHVPSDLGGKCECQRCLHVKVEEIPGQLSLPEDEKGHVSENDCEGRGVGSEAEPELESVVARETPFSGGKMVRSVIERMRMGLSFSERGLSTAVPQSSDAIISTPDRREQSVMSMEGIASSTAVCTRDENFVDSSGMNVASEPMATFDLATWMQRAPPQLVLRLLVTALVLLLTLSSLGTGEPWWNLVAEQSLSYI
ncbi:hypothetical protein CBR_g4074 [Chara braunii]|uniref:CRAL-TRIO domain-containing protein n=1 Tax=Chara braunii TaxID=69332 RepID=A0A388KH64_CHABU|nr:hypothetical protein CBR_g4074 [Chara braunii]|eukprot:GBG69381.1 hypothetical protein CBR_g4074 [Chara braunii]